MFSQIRVFRRGGLALIFLLLGLRTFAAPPQDWLRQPLDLLETAQKLLNVTLKYLDPFHDNLNATSQFPIKTDRVSIDWAKIKQYDFVATISDLNGDQKIRTFWNSKKTGNLPGPEDSWIQATSKETNEIQNINIESLEKTSGGQRYYQSFFKFTTTLANGTPLKRGVAEIFQDIQKQQIKISLSSIEGPAELLPSQMTKLNIQAVIAKNGYIFLREEEGTALTTSGKQQHYCRSPEEKWVSPNSREWDENCMPLFDGSEWHGFSFNLIPSSYELFLKN